MKAIIIWGTQLSIDRQSALVAEPAAPIIMIESRGVSKKYKFHKQKLLFIFTAMREYADELRASGRTVYYSKLDEGSIDWYEQLLKTCTTLSIDELIMMRQNDRTPQRTIETWCKQHAIKLTITPNLQFLTPTAVFEEWAEGQKRFQMEIFYRWQRKRLGILMDGDHPTGGTWNYDHENRKPVPKNQQIPPIAFPTPSKHSSDVRALIDVYFKDHPGTIETVWLPTTRRQSRAWLKEFIDTRFENFGAYEDAMVKGEPFLYHSALSALLNVGLLHPEEVVEAALSANVSLASKEGYIRQVIGWREFMFGLYHHLPEHWIESNYLQQHDKLPDYWWRLKGASEPPIQDALERLQRYGYSHHIERLMIFGNYMLLANYNPTEVYAWFMSMYVDAYEWVMVPNVIGMSQFADGGMDHGGFANKPYISGSNYLQKMGHWWPTTAAAKSSDWTEMYWTFLERNKDRLADNYRLRPLLKRFKKD
jgi:deoxyribodipyrimidine photolyase-related protein